MGRDRSLAAGASYAYDLFLDKAGSIYAVGELDGAGAFNFGNGKMSAGQYSSNGGVLVKYSSSGVAQWVVTSDCATGDSFYQSVAVDSSGNVYAAGSIYGTDTFSFGGGITAFGLQSGSNAALVKYDASGVAQWAAVASSTQRSYLNQVAVDGSGNAYVAGQLWGATSWSFGSGPTIMTLGASWNPVVAKFQASGTLQWAATTVTASGDACIQSLAVDAAGACLATGYTSGTGTYDFGDQVRVAGFSQGYNLILVKFDTSGTAQWSKTAVSGPDHLYSLGVANDSSGNYYLAGQAWYSGTYVFWNDITMPMTSATMSGFLLKDY